MDMPQARPAETAPAKPAKAVAANTGLGEQDGAPPAVPSAPSADTRGSASTSTAEGPSRPKQPLQDDAGPDVRHADRGGTSAGEVAPPGERVDDEVTDGKVTKRHD